MDEIITKLLRIEQELCCPGGPFEMEEAQVLGERMQVFKNRAPSLRHLLKVSAGFGEREYIVHGDRRVTYREHATAVASVARVLAERYGVKKGDRVAILAENRPEWIITFWAAVSLGAVAVGLNGWWVGKEIVYGLEDSTPRVLVGDEKRLARLEGVDVSVPIVRMETDFSELAAAYPDASLSDETISEDDAACILYTSGTTGRPKGVVNSHRNVAGLVGIQSFHGLRAYLSRENPSSHEPAMLVTSPLFHVSGLYAGAVIALATGIKSVWMGGRFDPVQAMQLIQEERVTNWGPMVTTAYRFAYHADTCRFDLSSVSAFGSGGSPMPRDLVERLRTVFPSAGNSAALGYGLTECTGLAALNFGEEYKQRPEASGRPLPTVQIQIRDAEGRPVEPGTEGEIYLRGPVVMLGYWGKPEDTARSVVAGRWLRTGDIGRFQDGALVINSRPGT